MAAAATITTIRPTICGELIPSEMLDTSTSMPAPTKDPYLVYKIALFQKVLFLLPYKDIAPTTILMKSVLFTLTILLSVAAKKCNKPKESLPACVQQRIDEIKKQPPWNPRAEVYEYEYNGIRVYYITSDCCDNYNTLIDNNCNYLCSPSGGITGKGDGKCPDFQANAKMIRLVWKDER